MINQLDENAMSILISEKIKQFVNSYIDDSRLLYTNSDGKLIHSGEFGIHRELITKDFLANFIPEKMGIDSGFVISDNGKISSQCDLVFYDKSVTPLIKNANLKRFFPVESVCAVGEIKSKLELNDLKKALRKLSMVKCFRDFLWDPSFIYCLENKDDRGEYKPELNEFDQMMTFLICEEFSFDLRKNLENIFTCYNSELPNFPPNLRHNIILSLKDGLIAYQKNDSEILYPFPVRNVDKKKRRLKHKIVFAKENSIEHIRHFVSLIHTGLNSITVLFPDMGRYIKGGEDLEQCSFDQEI